MVAIPAGARVKIRQPGLVQGVLVLKGDPGPDGPTGPPGSQIRFGTGAPANGLGSVGDMYEDTANGNVYSKTGPTTWALQDNLTGPQGLQGIQGIPGTPGTNGTNGTNGADGAPGAPGAAGVVQSVEGVSTTDITVGMKTARAATTGNITLSGAQTIDGVSVIAGDVVLVKDQTTGSQNGLYVAAAGAWSRATWADSATELAGSIVRVLAGTTNGGSRWSTSFKSTDTVGTTAMVWTSMASSSAAGLLGYKSYNSADYSTSSTTAVDVDATNMAVSFTVPASGVVLVRLTGMVRLANSGAIAGWGLRESTTNVQALARILLATVSNHQQLASVVFRISGLTPGAAKTYKWSYAQIGASGAVDIWTNSASANNPPATMEVMPG